MDVTYVVYSEEYYFSMNTFSTGMRKRIYNIAYDEESAKDVERLVKDALQKTVDSGELNANNEMLTTFHVEIIQLDKKCSLEEAKKEVLNDDFTWGKTGKNI